VGIWPGCVPPSSSGQFDVAEVFGRYTRLVCSSLRPCKDTAAVVTYVSEGAQVPVTKVIPATESFRETATNVPEAGMNCKKMLKYTERTHLSPLVSIKVSNKRIQIWSKLSGKTC
jgi:hypothetical protein